MAAPLIRELDAGAPAEVGAARALFAEYATSLGVDLAFQDFERELAELPAGYVTPTGVLLLAWDADDAVGCVGVRALPTPGCCEMKRLYVRPAARGGGLGRRLAEASIAAARRLGYERMLLDTLPSMGAAQELYATLGFEQVAPYRFNPVPGARFLELWLDPTG